VYTPPVRKICDIFVTRSHCREQSLAQNAPKSFVAGLRPDLLGELTALPQTPIAAFDSPTSKRGEGRFGEEKRGKGRGGEE